MLASTPAKALARHVFHARRSDSARRNGSELRRESRASSSKPATRARIFFASRAPRAPVAVPFPVRVSASRMGPAGRETFRRNWDTFYGFRGTPPVRRDGILPGIIHTYLYVRPREYLLTLIPLRVSKLFSYVPPLPEIAGACIFARARNIREYFYQR